jgi:hypothetical protein
MRLEFFHWGNDNCRLLRLILYTDEATYSREGINNTRSSHCWSEENPHTTVQTNFRHCLSANVWCGIIDNHLTEPVILEYGVTGRNDLEFLRNELPGLIQDGSSATRNSMYYQHDGAPPHSISVIKYLNETFPGRGNDHDGPVLSHNNVTYPKKNRVIRSASKQTAITEYQYCAIYAYWPTIVSEI